MLVPLRITPSLSFCFLQVVSYKSVLKDSSCWIKMIALQVFGSLLPGVADQKQKLKVKEVRQLAQGSRGQKICH